MPKVMSPPGFKGVVACLLRESPSLAIVETIPKVRQLAMLKEPMVMTMYATHRVQGQGPQGYLHGYGDCLSGESGPWEPLHGSHPPRGTLEELVEEDLAEGYP